MQKICTLRSNARLIQVHARFLTSPVVMQMWLSNWFVRSAETNEHLRKVEEAIESAKALLNRNSYAGDLRTVLVAGFIDQMIEYHAAMLLLIRSGMVGSAFVLARSIFESMYRGLWVNFCGTDSEIEKFEKEDRLPLTMREMAQAIDEKYRAGDFFVDLIDRGWKSLNS